MSEIPASAVCSFCVYFVRLVSFAFFYLTRFFDEFEAVYSQFNQAQLSTSLDNDQVLALLKKLDDCKSFVATNPQVPQKKAHAQAVYLSYAH